MRFRHLLELRKPCPKVDEVQCQRTMAAFCCFQSSALGCFKIDQQATRANVTCAVDGKASALYSQFSRARRTGVALSHFASCRLLNLQVALFVTAGVAYDTVNSLRAVLCPLFSPHKPLRANVSHHPTRRFSCHLNIPWLSSFIPCSPARAF